MHTLRNPVPSILGLSAFAIEDLPPPPPVSEVAGPSKPESVTMNLYALQLYGHVTWLCKPGGFSVFLPVNFPPKNPKSG